MSALLLVTHMLSAVVDSVSIDWISVVVPFTAGWRPVAVGWGTLALDLLVLIVVTSLVRGRIPVRLWRASTGRLTRCGRWHSCTG